MRSASSDNHYVNLSKAEFERIHQTNVSLLHDLSGPLTSASIHIEQLKINQTSDELIKLKRDINILLQYVRQAKDEISNQLNNDYFSLTETISKANEVVAGYAQINDVSIDNFNCRDTLIYGNQLKLMRGLINILNNSIESFVALDRRRKTIKISHRLLNNNLIEIIIEDNGCGIRAKDLSKIFRPYYSTKVGSRNHLGVGLSMFKEYIEKDLNGSISVASKYGTGTICKIVITI